MSSLLFSLSLILLIHCSNEPSLTTESRQDDSIVTDVQNQTYTDDEQSTANASQKQSLPAPKLIRATTKSSRPDVRLRLVGTANVPVSAYSLLESSTSPAPSEENLWTVLAAPRKEYDIAITFTLSPDFGIKMLTAWVKSDDGRLSLPGRLTIEHSPLLTNSWIEIPRGTFLMGQSPSDPNESPVHPVSLSSFSIMKHEVSAAEYALCVAMKFCSYAGPIADGKATYASDSPDDYPMNFVIWSEAKGYCQFVGGDLPTEAQWEYAARGPDSYLFPWGSTIEPGSRNILNCNESYCQDGFETLAPIGSFPEGESIFGVADMSGNVWEWGKEYFYSAAYEDCAQGCTDPITEKSNDDLTDRIVRGGSFSSNREDFRSAERDRFPIDSRREDIGFRCVK